MGFKGQFTVLLSALLVSCLALGQSNPGLIRGTVVDETGKPFVGARVDAETQSSPSSTIAARYYAEADENGEFTLNDLPFGSYKLYVSKEDQGYPDVHFSLYDPAIGTAQLDNGSPLAAVVLKTGPQAGTVQTKVVDAATGAPVRATLTLRRVEDATLGLSTSDQHLLLPPGKDVTLEVSANGYKTWTYADPSNPSQPLPIRLDSGQVSQLEIRLEPAQAQ